MIEHEIPAAEEKQILDAIKIVLENGYCVSELEMLEIFDIVGLRNLPESLTKSESEPFMHFLRQLFTVFEFSQESFNEYFGIEEKREPSI